MLSAHIVFYFTILLKFMQIVYVDNFLKPEVRVLGFRLPAASVSRLKALC